MQFQKIPHLSIWGLSVSVLTSATIGFITNPTVVQAQRSKLPTIAKVTSMTNGDLACYVDLVDTKGKKYQSVYAIFEICEKEKTFLNKKVRLTYKKEKFNDCQSIEPCGKTQLVTAITKMQIVR
ncbi:hypothetical protein [Cylindrospermum sp. FACHB-282]|uniref:hypothetical protein n=1 Tax=Cylindrospermum sp. FACHB-282 TaxID=2692794 RepID=UPI0016884229|nr:hypothetical protein [Cylindrospermum sp. FACHB-282]MBD2388115.1 hypothetical protein [Cylindrospermum sp. FACHB-282]